jgi:osmoprotectant transport system permease protein
MDVYTTDAEIPYYGILTLKDDRGHFPDYDALLLYRLAAWDRSEALRDTVTSMEDAIDEPAMQQMNRAVKIDGRPEASVAADFLGLDVAQEQADRWDRLMRRTIEHLEMVAISLGAAIILAIPLGIAAYRRPRFGQVILAAVGVLQTMPSLALLVLMIPLLGIGTTPAIFALFLYSLLPIVRNTHAGFAEIDPALRRAARGLGLTRRQVLRHVEMPLSLRPILAGVKTAAVINVGTATLGALIGAGGYGQPFLTGIRLDDMTLVLEGAIPAAVLALTVQWAFDGLEYLVVSDGLRLDERK